MPRAPHASAAASEVGDLVARCLELAERGGPAAVEALLDLHPAWKAQARERLQHLSRLGFLSGASALAGPRELPERLGPYRLIERLGAGGMGVVFLAEDETLGREVALKIVRPELSLFGPARERFRREIEASARLKHAGIVPVYSTGEEGGLPFFTMEHVEGCTLSEVLLQLEKRRPGELSGALFSATVAECSSAARRRRAGAPASRAAQGDTWTEACFRIALAVAEALQHAHESGVLHRDVKPSNVMVTPEGRVLLLDFGLAADAEASRMTRSGAELGSLAYMPPEHLRGEELDEQSDVYSLGVTLYELLTLRCPFLAPNAELTRKHILAGDALAIRATNPQVPSDAETVCLAAMDRERSRRYPSAAAFAADVRNVLEHRPIRARPPSPLLRARRFAQRHPAATVAALLGSTLAAGAIWFALAQAATNRALVRANGAKDAALAEAHRANDGMRTALARKEQINGILQRMIGAADPWKSAPLEPLGRDTKVVDVLEPARVELLEDPALDPVVAADVSSLLGSTYAGLGLPEEAEPLLERALALQREIHGASARETLTTAWRLSGLRIEQHRPAEARALLENTLAHARAVLPAEDPLLVDLWNDLALVHQTTGEPALAEEIYRRELALRADIRTPGAELQTALLSHNLGTLLLEERRLDEAGECIDRALELRRAHLPAGHARILASLNALGLLRQRQGRHEESLALFQELLGHVENALGKRHERTLRTRLNLAAGLLVLGRFEEAELASREIIALEEGPPEPGDPIAITARLGLAWSFARRGEVEPALEHCEEAAALITTPDDPAMEGVLLLRQTVLATDD